VPIDDKPPSAWNEADLQELCDEHRREGPRLEFKRELNLETDGQRKEAEHDAHAMANAGGGVIVYGIEEATLPDGGSGASRLRPLLDGSLYERLNSLLDDRGQPRLVFVLHAIPTTGGGMYLVLDVFGRRRPRQSHDGRYYMRRGTQKRRMQEAEVAEAYRDRLLREATATQPLLGEPAQNDLPADVAERVHRGLKPDELALWREETGETEPPGWMSVVVMPLPPRNVLDPVHDARRFQDTIDIPDRWDSDIAPLQYFELRPRANGLFGQLPARDDMAPGYLVAMFRDGVMEYGTTLEPALRRENPAENRIIFSASHTWQAHDYLQAFAVALGDLGYDGPVGAQVSFDHTRDVMLGVKPGRDVALHAIADDSIRGEFWTGERADLLDDAGRVVKQVMDLVFLAAGARNGCWLIDRDGRLLEH
jgi:hypothetical protein